MRVTTLCAAQLPYMLPALAVRPSSKQNLVLELSVTLGSGEEDIHPDPHGLRGRGHQQVVLQGGGDKVASVIM